MQDCLRVAKGVVVDHVLGGGREGVDSLQVPAENKAAGQLGSESATLPNHGQLNLAV
jgi:hypothetical protein